MLAFEISVNGKRLCVASTAEHCVLSTALSWAKHEGYVRFNLGGVSDDDQTQHSHWETPEVQIGDEITIRLVDTESFDPPKKLFHAKRNRE